MLTIVEDVIRYRYCLHFSKVRDFNNVILHIDVRITYRCNIESATFNTIINLES